MPSLNRQSITRDFGRVTLVAAGLTILALSLSGCQEGLGGGAAYEPVVRILPDAEAVEADTGGSAAPVEVAGYGNLKGRIVLDGSLPIPPAIDPTKDAVCIAKAPIPNDRLVVGPNNGLANVFVYLPKAPGGTKQPESLEPLKFDQKGCRFLPHCQFVHTDQTVLVTNSDATLHNTHTNPQRQPGFNQGVQPNEQDGVPLSYSRTEKQPVSVTCDIHPWMLAFQLPLDHPYGAVSGDDGTFEINDLPAGKHEFTIWHETGGEIDKRYEVEIPVDGTAEVEIKVPAGSLSQFRGQPSKRIVLSMVR